MNNTETDESNIKNEQLTALMQRIGYHFKSTKWLKIALSHRSYGKINNERLEFLGDSILNFIIASELFRRFPTAREGELTRMRSGLVKGETLALLAKQLNIGVALRLGQGEVKTGGALRPSILADSMEAIICAMYLDSDMETCARHVVAWYGDQLENMTLEKINKDPKSLLQEHLQSHSLPVPEYHLVGTIGEGHAQIFRVQCVVKVLDKITHGEGTSIRYAEQTAAAKMLEELRLQS